MCHQGGIIHLTMCIQTLSMPTEWCPFHIWVCQTIFHCTSSQLTSPTGEKQRLTQSPSKSGQGEPSLSCKTASHTPNGTFFEQQDPEEYTKTVLFYISTCVDNVTVNKHIRVFPKQKPWMTKEVQILLRTRDPTFRSGDRTRYSNLKKGIRETKWDYKRRIKDYLADRDPRRAWQ